MIKIISFDLDGTLTNSNYADLVWLEGLPKIYAKEKNINFKSAKKYLQKKYDEMGDNEAEWYDIEYWFNRFDLKYNWKKLLEDYKHDIQTFSEVQDVLNRLFKKYKLIIISNAKREFIEIQLKYTDLQKYFTYVFSSTSDFHKVKKVTEFYSMICNKLKIDSQEIIHVGDNKFFDYTIPHKIGIKSFFLDRKRTQKGKFIIHNLIEFEYKI